LIFRGRAGKGPRALVLRDRTMGDMTSGSQQRSLLFDLDGTIVRNDDLHFEAFKLMLVPFGRDLARQEFDEHVSGRANREIMEHLLPQVTDPGLVDRLVETKERHYRASASAGLESVRGLVPLLRWARDHGLAMAVVTNAPRQNAEMVLRTLRVEVFFTTIVIGDELADGKPHPLPYLTALERLGVPAHRAVAFEDSRSGVRSAKAAGVAVLGITGTLSRDELAAAGAEDGYEDFDHPELRTAIERLLKIPVHANAAPQAKAARPHE
jgi:HAD superfamily hydrolase (TIGR01509 family)